MQFSIFGVRAATCRPLKFSTTSPAGQSAEAIPAERLEGMD
jgi:hypothetical protein